MSENIAVKHQDVTITYMEPTGKWVYSVGGRERSLDSLAEARQAIDAYVERKMKDGDKADFQRRRAIIDNYGNVYLVDVTSDAGFSRYGREKEYWTVRVDGDKKREKIEARKLKSDTKENLALFAKIREIEEQRKKLVAEDSRLRSLLTEFKE